jgi:4Fe-4S ferredoxin
MNETVISTKDNKQVVYIPEKCIGCGTCVMVCPKETLVIGSVGPVARGLIDKEFLEIRPNTCITCGMCSKVCPTGALEMREDGKPAEDKTFLINAIKPTTVNDDCVHCGLCEQVCPQGCIEVDQWLSNDNEAKIDGTTTINQECCVHCGWCESVCPVDAIEVEKPFEGTWFRDEDVCQACRTCVDVCPCNALFNPDWEAGERVDKVAQRPDACIYCGACAVSCPVQAIDVKKTAIAAEMEKKKVFEKKLLDKPSAKPTLTSKLVTDKYDCLGCGNCVIVCPVNAYANKELAAGHLNNMDEKALLEVENGAVNVVDQEVCGSCGACAMICPTNAIWLEKREVE